MEFTSKTKNEMYTLYEAALFREPDDAQRFSYRQDDPLAGELAEQLTGLLRESPATGSACLPTPRKNPVATTTHTFDGSAVQGAAGGMIGDILFVSRKRKEPLIDASHVRSAIARFDQVSDVTDAEREQAFANIKKAAEHYGVEMTATSWKELGKAHAKK